MATTDNQVGSVQQPVRLNNNVELLPIPCSSPPISCDRFVVERIGETRSGFLQNCANEYQKTTKRIGHFSSFDSAKLPQQRSEQSATLQPPVPHHQNSRQAAKNKQLGSLIAADLELLHFRNLRLSEQQCNKRSVRVSTSASSLAQTGYSLKTWPINLQSHSEGLISEPLPFSSRSSRQQTMHNNNTDHQHHHHHRHHTSTHHQISHLNLGHPIQSYHQQLSDPGVDFVVQQSAGAADADVDVDVDVDHSVSSNQLQQQQQQQHYQAASSLNGSEMAELLVGRNQHQFTSLQHSPLENCSRPSNLSYTGTGGISSGFNSASTVSCELLDLNDVLGQSVRSGIDDTKGQQELHQINSYSNQQPHQSSSSTPFHTNNSRQLDGPLSYANLEPATQQLCQFSSNSGSQQQQQPDAEGALINQKRGETNCRLASDESSVRGAEETSSDLVPDSVFQLSYQLISNSNSHQQLHQQQQQQQQHNEATSLTELNSLGESSSCCQLELLGGSCRSNHSTGCASTFARSNHQRAHLVAHSSSQIELNLVRESIDYYDSTEPELKVCEWDSCGNTFLDIVEFVKHLEERHVNQEPREKNRYYCLWSNCKRNEQEFNARYKLLIHMRVHSGEKPYPCNIQNCNKSFSRLENLKIHQRSHTGEKPYKCNFDGCLKSFTNSSDRIKHHKTHKDPKPYSCNYSACLKRYTDPSSLRKHLRVHKRAEQDHHQQQQMQQQQQQLQLQNSHQPEVAATQQAYSSSLSALSTNSGVSQQKQQQQQQQPMQPVQQQQSSSTSYCPFDYQPSQLFVPFAPESTPTSIAVGHTGQWPDGSTHAHLSRSWCAGSRSSGVGIASRPARGYYSQQSSSLEPSWRQPINANTNLQQQDVHHPQVGAAEQMREQQQQQLQQHQLQQQQQHFFPTAHTQITTNHETLMRSLPPIWGSQALGAQ